METPICDFVRAYAESKNLRLHMPGHKGSGSLGVEALDITEIPGADSLYEANGIIRESERNASLLFGSAETLYSTEGSSHAIRAMLYLVRQYALHLGKRPRILAGRNVHKTFVTAAGLLKLEVEWLFPEPGDSYLNCNLRPETLERILKQDKEPPVAVYITSPDYLGSLTNLDGISEVCHRYGVLLLVDQAHGAYLKFLRPFSLHALDHGADLCCDSAHKTLPVLTGGAYLHISRRAPEFFREAEAIQARSALAVFGSTSPSYLILQSLDAANKMLSDGLAQQYSELVQAVTEWKHRLQASGWEFVGQEPLKLTIKTKGFGYRGDQLSRLLEQQGVFPEFADPDFLVMMISPSHSTKDLQRLAEVLSTVPRLAPIIAPPPIPVWEKQAVSIHQAMFSPKERIKINHSLGRILATVSVSCPPAVPILVCGERISASALEVFRYYGIEECDVIREGL